jgi:hypothetical protein
MEWWETGGAGAGGTLIGAILTWLGFKSRLDMQDKKVEKIESIMVTKQVCQAMERSFTRDIDALAKRLDEKFDGLERRFDDLKEFIKNNSDEHS